MEKILPMLVIFLEWMRQQPQFLKMSDLASVREYFDRFNHATLPAVFRDPEVLSKERCREVYAVPPEVLRKESRSRSSLRSALSMLQELWNKGADSHTKFQEPPPTGFRLREHAELRGFLPVKQRVETYFADYDPLQKGLPWIGDQKARLIRPKLVQELMEDLLKEEEKSAGIRSSKAPVTEKIDSVPLSLDEGEPQFSLSLQQNTFPPLLEKFPSKELFENQDCSDVFNVHLETTSVIDPDLEGVDEVVFQPRFLRSESSHPFLALKENKASISSTNKISGEKIPLESEQKAFENDIFASLGILQSKSRNHSEISFADDPQLQPLTSSAKWDDLNSWNLPPQFNENEELQYQAPSPAPGLLLESNLPSAGTIPSPPGLSNVAPRISSPPGLGDVKRVSSSSGFISYLKSPHAWHP